MQADEFCLEKVKRNIVMNSQGFGREKELKRNIRLQNSQ